MTKPENDLFELDGAPEQSPPFELTPQEPVESTDLKSLQPELFLPQFDEEHPEADLQQDLGGLEKPSYKMQFFGHEQSMIFEHAPNLLQSLEVQGVKLPYQCREGYCGSCRTRLVEGDVAYLQPPIAWVNEGEVLPCICVPKTDLRLANPLDLV